ncbi:hypothetical protein SAY87_027471 [Trapa incisa]|uniref:Uncharacterized protein n=1 Tax=Trapa incisa TaxID=236973 RepID=A0AAN7JLY3_9MYRT|nr:hypothetical protein SAY87_027471 [Trapa incisa]
MDNFGDTTLRLNCLGYGGSNTLTLGNDHDCHGAKFVDSSSDGCRLVLGLGPAPSTCYYGLNGTDKGKGLTAMPLRVLASEGDSMLKLGPSGVTKEIFGLLEGENNFSTALNNHDLCC